MNKLLPVLIVALITLTACGKKDPVEPTPPVVTTPVENQVERPDFNAVVDEEDAFNKALEAIPADEVPQFVEVIDEGNADEIQGVEEGDEEWEEREAAKVAYAQEMAIKQANSGAGNKGLEIRDYSSELWDQVNGTRSAVLYFSAKDCEECDIWQARVRGNAADYADKNALIIVADIDEHAALATEFKVLTPNTGMTLSPIGETMGPIPGSVLTQEYMTGFIFQ